MGTRSTVTVSRATARALIEHVLDKHVWTNEEMSDVLEAVVDTIARGSYNFHVVPNGEDEEWFWPCQCEEA